MKRSEMLKLIIDLVHEYRRCTEGVSSAELGEMILTKCEEMEMLPPTRIAETWGELGIDSEEDESPRFYLNKWEQE